MWLKGEGQGGQSGDTSKLCDTQCPDTASQGHPYAPCCPLLLCVQVVVWGGQAFNTSGPRVRLSSMMYVLDFASRPPRWRQAHIHLNNQGAFQFEFPSTGLVMLPEFGAVALKHRSVSGGGRLHPGGTAYVLAALDTHNRAVTSVVEGRGSLLCVGVSCRPSTWHLFLRAWSSGGVRQTSCRAGASTPSTPRQATGCVWHPHSLH